METNVPTLLISTWYIVCPGTEEISAAAIVELLPHRLHSVSAVSTRTSTAILLSNHLELADRGTPETPKRARNFPAPIRSVCLVSLCFLLVLVFSSFLEIWVKKAFAQYAFLCMFVYRFQPVCATEIERAHLPALSSRPVLDSIKRLG